MTRFILVRLLQGIFALFLASVIVFGLIRLTGDPASTMLSESASAEDVAMLRAHLGLDKPIVEQYWIFISHAVIGDFGNSLRYQAPVMGYILDCAPATLKLTGASILVSILIALPIGILGAAKRDKWQDTTGKLFAILGQSTPAFWLGIVLIELISVKFGLLPAGGNGGFKYYILPAITLGWNGAAGIPRFTRSSMLDVLDTDFVRLARIKGASENSVLWKHALRNALIPVVTFSGMIFVHWLMGTVVVETVFAWPGLGQLAYQAVRSRDFPMLQGLMLIFVCVFIFANLIIDVLYCYLDPRVRYVK